MVVFLSKHYLPLCSQPEQPPHGANAEDLEQAPHHCIGQVPTLSERCEFLENIKTEAANDNVAENYLVPVGIPAAKQAAREMLAVAMKTSSIRATVCKPKEAPTPETWKPLKPKAGNDNRELVSWPFLGKLKRDGQHEDAELIEQYRGLISLMAVNPLQGQDPSRFGDGLVIAERTYIDGEDVEEAAATGFKGSQVPGGDLDNKGERVAAKSPGTASHARQTDDKTIVVMRPMDMRFNERTLIAQIDMSGIIERLRQAMGPLVAPFEDAVLGGLTMREIGEARHFKDKQAEAAGKALVMTALDAVRAEWSEFRKEQRQAEDQADRNVARRRAELEAERARFLGRAA